MVETGHHLRPTSKLLTEIVETLDCLRTGVKKSDSGWR